MSNLFKYTVQDWKDGLAELEAIEEDGTFLEPSEVEKKNYYQNLLDFCEAVKNDDELEIDDANFSSASMSTYLDVECGDYIYNVRFSNHLTKPYHTSPDFDYDNYFDASEIVEAIKKQYKQDKAEEL